MPAFKKIKKGHGSPKLTEEVIQDICNYLRRGAFIETCVIMAGVGKTTYYEWIKLSLKEEARRTKRGKLCIALRNAVAKANQEATMRDLVVVDKCAMGVKPVYDRYPKGTVMPVQDNKGKVQLDHNHEVIYIDVSGQIITDHSGKPVIAEPAMPPDWKASAWRLEKRAPKDWGQALDVDRPDVIDVPVGEDDPNKIVIEFVDSPADIALMEKALEEKENK